MVDGDFYIGYRRQAPPALARFVRRLLLLLGVIVLGLGALLASSQQPFDAGRFEFGVERGFEGWILEEPYPLLVVEERGTSPRIHLLVDRGKHGAADSVAGLDRRAVRLRGSLIQRGSLAMIELAPGAIEPLSGGAAPPAVARRSLGTARLRGEIVDGKCFLGVMKPGRDKPHRDCAARCIAGGAPPLFWVPGAGDGATFVLADARGGALVQDLRDWVGEPLEIEGSVTRLGELSILAADPRSYRRLDG